MGHLQTFPAGQAMSALPLEADVGEPICNVGLGPGADTQPREWASFARDPYGG